MRETVDRESLLLNASIIDRLDTGWQPGDRELETARFVQDWVILPSEMGIPYRLRGIAWSLPVSCTLIDAGLVALDRRARWARLCSEWVVIDDPIESGVAVEPGEIHRASEAWLLREIERLPAPN